MFREFLTSARGVHFAVKRRDVDGDLRIRSTTAPPVLLIFSVTLPSVTATWQVARAGEDAPWAVRTRLTAVWAGGSNSPAMSPTIRVRGRRTRFVPGTALPQSIQNRTPILLRFRVVLAAVSPWAGMAQVGGVSQADYARGAHEDWRR